MKKLALLFLAVAGFATASIAQQMPPCPLDPNVRTGQLENGLTYYIRHNEKPAQRANFYIAQKVGSILEEEEQRGLAHFLEHMCFNGTQHFPGKDLLNYMEHNGVKFGEIELEGFAVSFNKNDIQDKENLEMLMQALMEGPGG